MAKEICAKKPCPQCRKTGNDATGNNLSTYEDGVYCWACGFTENTKRKQQMAELVAGNQVELADRGISLETVQKYNVRTCQYTGFIAGSEVSNELTRIFPIYEFGKVVKQKLKVHLQKKLQTQKGVTDCVSLFGQNCFSPNPKIPVIVTEGEEDALSMFQMSNLPSVSVTRGANGAAKEIAANLEWLGGFKEVLLCFDNDEAGKAAIDECVKLFEPGAVKVVTLPLKDANEMLLADRAEEIKKCLWNAEILRPKTIVFPRDIREKVLQQPQWGSPWPWQSMTKATYGMRMGEVYLLAAATSQGKTEVIREIITMLLDNGIKIGLFSFEQQPAQTMQRFIGASINKRLHLPGCDSWDVDIITSKLDAIGDTIALYQPESGNISLDGIITNIRFLNKCYGMTFFVIDNLKALSTSAFIDGKRVPMHEYASHCMSSFVTLAKQLNINLFVVNHLSADKISLQAYVSTSPKNPQEYDSSTAGETNKRINKPGLTWDSGRVPSIENIFGGGAIKDLADYIMVLSRNRMSQDPEEHRTTNVKFLKTRMDSQYEGFTFQLKYNYSTGRLVEYFGDVENRKDVPAESPLQKDIIKGVLE